jgi:uncharacterized protein (DUF934 family)
MNFFGEPRGLKKEGAPKARTDTQPQKKKKGKWTQKIKYIKEERDYIVPLSSWMRSSAAAAKEEEEEVVVGRSPN